jgi:hypothetical protein
MYINIWGNSGKFHSKPFVLTSHTRKIELKNVGEEGARHPLDAYYWE